MENVKAEREKLTTLRWYDILIVTIIMFSAAMYTSFGQYQALVNNTVTLEQNITFDATQNYQSIINQTCWLVLAIAYLWLRKFDFRVLSDKIKLNKWVPLQAIAIFILAAIPMDILYMLTYSINQPVTPSIFEVFRNLDASLIQYSFLNGFYEEIFFLGICLAVDKKYIKWAFLYSLVIRFSFHTYQGMTTALGLGFLLGTVFFVLYKKLKPENLLPFFLAHAVADMIGLSFIFYFMGNQ